MSTKSHHHRRLGWAAALAAFIGLATLYTLVARPYHMRWGATDAEVAMAMPGDALEVVPFRPSKRLGLCGSHRAAGH